MKKSILFLAVLPLLFTGCSDDDKVSNDIKVNNPDIEIKAGKNVQIDANSPLAITYVSANEFYASVSQSGNVTANRVGEVEILLENTEKTAKAKINILPNYTTYKDPYLKFGGTKDDVIKYAGQPSRTSTDGGLVYDSYSSSSTIAMYMFEGSKYEAFGITVKTSYATELGNFLRERYFQLGSKNYSIYYINSFAENTATIAVAVSAAASGITVIYIPVEQDALRSDDSAKIDLLMDKLRNANK